MRYQDKTRSGTMRRWGTIDGTPYYDISSPNYPIQGSVSRSDIQRVIRSPTGWRSPTDYIVEDSVKSFSQGTASVATYDERYPDQGVTAEGYSGGATWTPDYSNITRARLDRANTGEMFSRLANKNLLKLRDQKVNLALTIGEFHKSVDTIASVALKLTTSYRKLRRLDFKGAVSALGLSTKGRGKTFANTWLEMQYGIKPMMQDVAGIYDELTRKTRQHGWQIRVKSRETFKDSFSGYYPDGGASADLPSGWLPHFGLDAMSEVTTDCFQSLWYEVDNPALVLASSVGLTNPAEIIWEVTPWSFVVDWFLPIGDYLGALTADHGFIFKGGSNTSVTRYRDECSLVPKGPWRTGSVNSVVNTPLCNGKLVVETFRMNRSGVSVPPSPSLPTFKNPFSTGHVLNALALLRSTR